MKKVATINGVNVFSDKSVSSIQNTKITFSDGSWCDVNTNEVVNQGKGGISIGNSGKKGSSKKITKPAQTFKASKLELETLAANIIVKVEERSDIEVSMEGIESELKDISLKQESGTLKVSGKSNNTSNSQTIIGDNSFSSIIRNSFSSGNISINGSSISIDGNTTTINGKEITAKITIKVPRHTPIKTKSIIGNVLIGDTEGDINISNLGSTNYNIGKITNAQIQSQGSGDVTIKSVAGNVSTNSMGSGDIDIKNGNIENLTISCMGSGDFSFNGKAKNASITSMGSGDVDINKIENRPSISKMGSGDVDIGNW